MSQHYESEWLAQVRQHWAKADATKSSKGRKKAWDEALVAPSETELEAREEKAKDRDWLYIEQRREVYSTVKLAWDIVDRSGVVASWSSGASRTGSLRTAVGGALRCRSTRR